MEVKNAIKTIIQAAGKNDKDISTFLGIAPPSYSGFINGDLRQINRIIKICELCGCQLQITNNNGLTITLDTDNKKTPE